MSRKRKRKSNRASKRRSANAVQEQPKTAASPLQRLLEIADDQPDPRDALEMFQVALDECQHVAAVSVFENADGCLWDIPDARCYVRAVFGVATSLWRLNDVEEAARHFQEVLQADGADHLMARYWLAAGRRATGRAEAAAGPLRRTDCLLAGYPSVVDFRHRWRLRRVVQVAERGPSAGPAVRGLLAGRRLGAGRCADPFQTGTQCHAQHRAVVAARLAVRSGSCLVGAARAPGTARPGRGRAAVSARTVAGLATAKRIMASRTAEVQNS